MRRSISPILHIQPTHRLVLDRRKIRKLNHHTQIDMRSFLALKAATAVILGAQSTLAQNWDGVPTTGKVVNGVQYLGCPVEIPGRVLTGVSYSDDAMTIESCAAYCTKNNLPLFGVEYGRECYCGRYISPTVNMPGKAGDCNMNCKNNKASLSKQMCGGVNRMSVFNVTTFAGPGAIKNNADWGYMSCFMEPQWGRALSNLVKPDDKMTINMCFDTCKAGGYSYAGLEYGRECWCGNTVAPVSSFPARSLLFLWRKFLCYPDIIVRLTNFFCLMN